MSEKRQRRVPWWKTHEKVSYLFEKLLKPLETQILHDTRHRDVVGTFRQLDVGIIDDVAGEKRVKSFVEVQKRRTKVTIQNLGDWDYKRRTLGASEVTFISEAGFTASVIDHVKTLHSDTIKLGLLHPIEIGVIERFNSACLGIVRVFDLWWFAAIMVQYADKDEIAGVPLDMAPDQEAKIFGSASPMDLIRAAEAQLTPPSNGFPPGFSNIIIECAESKLIYNNRNLRRVIIVVEKQRRIWEPKTRFFAYSGIYPVRGQQGIAIISEFKLDLNRNGSLILVVLPDPENVSGNYAKMAGQFEFI
jgi:hypothetical protein